VYQAVLAVGGLYSVAQARVEQGILRLQVPRKEILEEMDMKFLLMLHLAVVAGHLEREVMVVQLVEMAAREIQ
jgi:hypothetical protein